MKHKSKQTTINYNLKKQMLKVLHSGFFTSIQDCGRFGYREYGVPVSGAMDSYSSQFANAVLGNDANDAVLEMTMSGGTFQFFAPTLIAVAGGFMHPKLNDKPIKHNIPIVVKANDVLRFGFVETGLRTYVAVKGGFKTKCVLESRSQYKSITNTAKLNKGDVLLYNGFNDELKPFNASVSYDDSVLISQQIEVFKGPEFNRLTAIVQQRLLNTSLQVSKNHNRMAYQLVPLLVNDLQSILTTPVLPGTVQLTPNGNLIILMRDCQTTGGYPRVLQLTEQGINRLSQKNSGSGLIFKLVN